MKKWIERALNIHSGDLGRGTLLCACLFLVILGGLVLIGPALMRTVVERAAQAVRG